MVAGVLGLEGGVFVSCRVDVSDDFVVGNIQLVEFQLRLWIAVIHTKGTFGHWNLEFESAVILKFDRS